MDGPQFVPSPPPACTKQRKHMAKSIRSKVKKRNRSAMRKAVGVPFQDKVSARCTAKINESMRFKRGRGISKLKAVLTAAQVANPAVEDKPKHNFVFSNPSAPPKPDKMVEAPEEDLEEVEEEEESVVEAMLDINETVMEAEAEDTNQLIPSKKDKRRYANRPSKRKKTVFF